MFLAFLLISFTLSVGFMPAEYPDMPAPTYAAMGALSALLLFLSVLVHELAHSYVAIRSGVEVRRIVLYIFGGAAEIKGEPKNPSMEFKVSLAGPLTSVALGAILWFSWHATKTLPLGIIFTAVVEYGSFINFLLAGFNLIPAFPMDGGRLLRAAIWSYKRDIHAATRVASQVGSGFAYLFIVLGLVVTLISDVFSGLWFVFIGWFLKSAAESSLTQATISEALGTIRVREIMTTSIHTVDPSLPVKDLVESYFLVYKHGGFPVVSGETLLGMVTMGDVKKVPREKWQQTQCGGIMTPASKLVSIKPESSASDTLLLMSEHEVGRLPVLQDGRLVGIVSRSDLTRTLRIRSELAK